MDPYGLPVSKRNAISVAANFKPSVHNVVITRINFANIMALYAPIVCVRFARYCGKM